jgi:hypothetical protein
LEPNVQLVQSNPAFPQSSSRIEQSSHSTLFFRNYFFLSNGETFRQRYNAFSISGDSVSEDND